MTEIGTVTAQFVPTIPLVVMPPEVGAGLGIDNSIRNIVEGLQAQLVYLEEYQSLLGQIRKEFPAYDAAVNSGWRMAAKDKPSDSEAKMIMPRSGKRLSRSVAATWTRGLAS